jgi:hypothetical protein
MNKGAGPLVVRPLSSCPDTLTLTLCVLPYLDDFLVLFKDKEALLRQAASGCERWCSGWASLHRTLKSVFVPGPARVWSTWAVVVDRTRGVFEVPHESGTIGQAVTRHGKRPASDCLAELQ